MRRIVLYRELNLLALEIALDRLGRHISVDAHRSTDHLGLVGVEFFQVLEVLERRGIAELRGSVPAEQKRDGGGSDGNLDTLRH